MDRRVKYTKNIIKNTFIELLKEKEISKISVSELCNKADINRATFYRYYIDIYDLLEKIEQDLILQLKEMLYDKSNQSMKEVIEDYLNLFLDNKDLIRLIFINRKSIIFLNDFFEFIYEKCKIKWFEKVDNINEKDMALVSIFIFNGTLGIINYWVQNNFKESINEISSIIEKISYNGILSFKNN